MPVMPPLTNSFAIAGHEIFDRLSDAVLSDAIKLQTASALAQQRDSPSMSLATSANSPVSVPSTSIPLQYPPMQHIQHIQQTQQVPRADYINHWNLRMQQQQTQPDRSQGYCSCTGVRRKQRGQQFRLGNEELCLRQRPRTACATSRVRIQRLGNCLIVHSLGRGSVVGAEEVYDA